MDPHEFLRVANDLLAGEGEAESRSAVSRAYYAVFHQTRRLFTQCGFQVPKADRAHAYLWLRLSNCGNEELANAGMKLSGIRSRRNQADYDLHQSWTRLNAVGLMDVVKVVMKILDEALTSADMKATITTAIRDYETNILKQPTWHP